MKKIADNRKAFYDYEIMEAFEAGIVLTGTEIKAIRSNSISIKDSYVRVNHQYEAFIVNMFIAPYSHGNIFNHDERRQRKLLLHKKEIIHLQKQMKEKSLTVVPLKAYLKNGILKLEIALARGKKNYDKRESEKQKDASREIQKAIKNL